MRLNRGILGPALAVLLAPAAVQAEVTASSDGGFDIAIVASVPVAPETAFAAFTGEIGRWWNGAHSFSADAANLSLDAHCFCERWGDNRVVHLQVGQFLPPTKLRLLGGLGPLQGLPVTGVMDVDFAAGEEGTATLSLRYVVRGGGLGAWAAPVEGVLAEQVARFVAHVEGDAPAAAD